MGLVENRTSMRPMQPTRATIETAVLRKVLLRSAVLPGKSGIMEMHFTRHALVGGNMIILVTVPYRGNLMKQLFARTGRVLTFDVGGSHVAAALCALDTLSSGSVISGSLSRVITLGQFLDLLYNLGLQASGHLDALEGAVLAMPGPFDYSAGISRMRHKLQFLYGIDLRQALAERFGWIPAKIRFVNDADAFLLGELGAGAAQGAKRAVGITLGTGIGSAFACRNCILTDGQDVPPGAEIWNLPFGAGTVEDAISTFALQRDNEARTGAWKEVTAIAFAATSEAEACASFEAFGRNLGAVAGDILAQFSPEIIVFGGGISRAAHLFLPAAEKALGEAGFRLATSNLWDRAALVGGAVYWRETKGASMREECNAQLEPAQ
jgi:glucokinase